MGYSIGRTRLGKTGFQRGILPIPIHKGGQTQARQWSCPIHTSVTYIDRNNTCKVLFTQVNQSQNHYRRLLTVKLESCKNQLLCLEKEPKFYFRKITRKRLETGNPAPRCRLSFCSEIEQKLSKIKYGDNQAVKLILSGHNTQHGNGGANK